jgi:hypothetical protein
LGLPYLKISLPLLQPIHAAPSFRRSSASADAAARRTAPRFVGFMLLNFALLLLCWPAVHGDTGEVLREFVGQLKALQDTPPVCTPVIFGTGFNGHALCDHNSVTSRECFYINYGIAADWSFDTVVTSKLNCSGVALDPTVNLPVEIVPGVYFLKLAPTC